MKEIRDILGFWAARPREPLALATLVSAQGSSYRRPGARMLISGAGESAGGVSAGCIEEEVIACAREVLRTGIPRMLTFDTRLRFGCHGSIDVFVEQVAHEVMAELNACMRGRQRCRLATSARGDAPGTRIAPFEPAAGVFVQEIQPSLRLVLIGESDDTTALRTHAALLGWEVLVFAAAPVPEQIFDDRVAVVIATHNFGRDCAALRSLLPLGLRYIGLVGARRRRDDILFDVLEGGVAPKSALYAPAGLHLGADSPEEIALSIVAEIQCVFGAGTGQQLRQRKAPIHEPARGALACVASVP